MASESITVGVNVRKYVDIETDAEIHLDELVDKLTPAQCEKLRDALDARFPIKPPSMDDLYLAIATHRTERVIAWAREFLYTHAGRIA